MLFPSPFFFAPLLLAAALAAQPAVRTVSWDDMSSVRATLEGAGLTAASFPRMVETVQAGNLRRMREGDLDHLVFYLLQSTRFTSEPPIEPALSARALVDGLDPDARARFLAGGELPADGLPATVRRRAAALLQALDRPETDARARYFSSLVETAWPARNGRQAALLAEYVRAMRFLYQQEFAARLAPDPAQAVARLYRDRGLSTDTAVEAGFLVHAGLGVVKALQPGRRIRRVLIVGPGLDLAPRTAFRDDVPPHSYQPWSVADALLALGLSRLDDLTVVAADINPRVVSHLDRASAGPLELPLTSEIAETGGVTLTPEYRAYFADLGRAMGEPRGEATAGPGDGRLRKTVAIPAKAAGVLRAARLDIVTERLDGQRFDLIVATNILPYFGDLELTLALVNVAAMLEEGGVFLHNERRPLLLELAEPLGVPFVQARHAVIANVRGAPAPLTDSVFLHRKR